MLYSLVCCLIKLRNVQCACYIVSAELITSDKGGGKMFLPVLVCLSACLLATLLKNACMDLDEMLCVDRCRDMDELINSLA